ncbi:MAG: TetR/AcrR family transcriptional regulator [Deltaproteobacteria bacterium]|nr:TetR/AcrR family transcriptional regulator [Deltaproteobacteria bacterium]
MKSAATVTPLGKGDRTAARIREVALDQFSRLGFERVTMAGIAQVAGVSQATLHYHFADKDQLWRSAMLALSAVIAEEERLLAVARDAPAIAQLRMALRLFLQISWRHPALGRIIALEGMAGGERLEWLSQHLFGTRNRRLMGLVERAIADGDLKPFSPAQVVITLQTGAVGIINLRPLLRTNFGIDPDTPESRAEHEELVLDGLLAGLTNRRATRKGER